MKIQEYKITGMSCNHCVMAVKKELSKIAGLTIESVEIGKARVKYDESVVRENDIIHAIQEAGYKVE